MMIGYSVKVKGIKLSLCLISTTPRGVTRAQQIPNFVARWIRGVSVIAQQFYSRDA
jgi:hypothetical protein